MAEMVPDEHGGRPKPVEIKDSNRLLPVTAIMGAIGQQGDYSFLEGKYADKIKTERGRFLVDKNQQTTDPKVFAGGDAVNKTADAISAIADGFRATKAIDEMLAGKK